MVLCFKFNKKTENKVNDKVSNEYIASYFDGEYQTEIPGKNDGYIVDKIVCDNGASATWDNEEWGINIRNATKKIKCSIYFVFKTEYVFDYTGTEQVFTVPKTGTYKLETWGAQGGKSTDGEKGGFGGYSAGYISLKNSELLYVNVGQTGINGQNSVGGYNGGGDSEYVNNGSGGGATCIANNLGLLFELENYKNSILIVSGGGGGATTDNAGGAGGGINGNNGIYGTTGEKEGLGGTQFSGGTGSSDSGSFGKGGNGNAAGGGGGFYGGGSTKIGIGKDSSAGGGSGYIGNSLLTNKVMYCYNCEESNEESTKTISTKCAEETPTANCAKKGNGYARITYIE